MKKSIISILSLILFCSSLMVSVCASNTEDARVISSKRIDLENGCYIIEEVSQYSETVSTRATQTVSGDKTSTYYNSSSEAIFRVKVVGKFSYTGSSSWSTSASATVYIYDDSASFVSKSASYDSNYATATGEVKYNYVTIPRTVTLYCDKNGNLS